MINRVIPKISSGEICLLLTETLCFNPLEGLKICIPTSDENTGRPGKDITFNFIFIFDQSSNREVQTSIDNNHISILINNFNGALISGLLKPLTFQFGNVPIILYFSGSLIEDKTQNLKMMHFTVSIYQGKN